MIHFNIPPITGNEVKYIQEAIQRNKIAGDGEFTRRCSKWIEDRFMVQKCLLTTSGTAALEMAALLCDIEPGDEVILPSYTFSSTATAFVLAGAKLVFVDINPNTMNLDVDCVKAALSDKTKVICVVHYAGVSCEMDDIMEFAKAYNIKVVEDAAQGIMSTYKGKPLGTIGDFGCFSFHETKNFSMGEGGALLINKEQYNVKAEILREKGTNRSQFFRGQVAKYNWIDYGSSYLPSELNAAYLWAQLELADTITDKRMMIWNKYDNALKPLVNFGVIDSPVIPKDCMHNAHMYYIKTKNIEARTEFISYMKSHDILSPFHYVPLHSAPGGRKYGKFHGEDIYTTNESKRLVRLPIYFNMDLADQDRVISTVLDFFECRSEKLQLGI